MSKTITTEDVKKSVKDNDVRFLRLASADINGTSKAIEVPTSQLDKVLTNDIRFGGSSIDSSARLEESDMVLCPDFPTWAVLPWEDEKGRKIGRLVYSIHKTNGEPFEGNPRNNLKHILREVNDMGFADFDVGFEAEFHLFKLGEDGNWTIEVPDHASYFDMTLDDEDAKCRHDIVGTLESIGLEVEAAHHEVGDGQQETDPRSDDVLTIADRVQTFKMVVRGVARKHGLYATFTAKPVKGQVGNGVHTNMPLFKSGKNIFCGKDGEFRLSDTVPYFLNGVLEYARAITAIGNPIVNSYKRLTPGFEAPVYVSWTSENRSPLVKISDAEEINTRLEMRSTDPTASPYLLLATCLSAGLNGIKEAKKPMAPITPNVFEMSKEERAERGIKPLPFTLHNAVKIFKADPLIQRALGEHLAQSFTDSRDPEWSECSQSVSDWEGDRYMGC